MGTDFIGIIDTLRLNKLVLILAANNCKHNETEAPFSFQKNSHSTRHIESSDTCMKH